MAPMASNIQVLKSSRDRDAILFGKLTKLDHLRLFVSFQPAVTKYLLQTKGVISRSMAIAIHLKTLKFPFVILGVIDKLLDDPYKTDINCCMINP